MKDESISLVLFLFYSMNRDLKQRTKEFAVRVIKLYTGLPRSTVAQILGKQILRSGTSVGAQYRESQYAKSDADLVSKLEGSLQEHEETEYWLELIEEMSFFSSAQLEPLRIETGELKAIFITIVKKVKARKR